MSTYEVKAGLAEVEPFTVAGISIVTDNERAAEDINTLWQRFFEERVGQNIPSRTDDVIYAVYSDYEGDHTKPYRLTIGYRVKNIDEIHCNMHSVPVRAGEYAVMSAAGGQPRAMLAVWEAVWSGDLDRAYGTDFEVYGSRFFEEGVHEVLVHVGVK
ncbi:MAG: GyrI-like domain-containing protein [Alphaproteobacteria bacterium]|nr:GyrI-like domain-containing protein [Alphaproteobacteria bacterium]